ncbi:MAG: phosphoribosylamine--glycine ligase [Clostridiales bacterium]|nr:phosphoribosylamine--glycine ligase [Clostridiales bacterium]
MKILVIGGGGREHAIIRKLKENPQVTEIFALPGNGGISYDAQCLSGSATDLDAIVSYAKEKAVDFAVVAPDDPLVLGAADRLREAGFPTFGPSAAAAAIEGSKVFSKNLMKKYNIPTADYGVFEDPADAMEYIKQQGKYPVVVKADGLALGKGVIIAQSEAEAEDALKSIMEDKVFGASGNRVVVEEFLTGPEVTVLSFTDSKTLVPMVSSMDHKRALDGDEGLNTGGMGVIAPNPCYTPEIAEECMKTIFLPTIEAMKQEGRPFKGCLYFGLMLTPDGPRVIEYNCRFGDPETQAILPLLETDLLTVFQAVEEERLSEVPVTFRKGASCCLVLASGGYPQAYEKGLPITGLVNGNLDGVQVYHAGTKRADDQILTNGGRVLGVTALADTLEEAIAKAYAAAENIHFDKMHFRKDIGQKALALTAGK